MTIKKYTGKTKEEAIEAAKAELGSSVVIMNIKEVKGKGLAGMFKSPTFEVTAAIEEDAIPVVMPITPKQSSLTPRFSAVADEEIHVPPMESAQEASVAAPVKKPAPVKPAFPVDEEDLRSAFEEISAVVEKGGIDTVKPMGSQESPLVKRDNVAAAKKPEPVRPAEDPRVIPATERVKKQINDRNSLADDEQKGFLKILYNTLMDNEVEQRYVNQILENLDPMLSAGSSLDHMINNIYQKMVLMFGKPKVITLSEKRPKVVFIIGPTGVGKTTTIAKLAAKYMLEKGKKVGLLTSDTYRIAATDQLQVYARILSAPFTIIVDNENINDEIKKMRDMDLILVDTAGFSHKNQEQRVDLAKMLDKVDEAYEKEIYLVLSATTKYHDLREIVDTYRSFTDFDIIFTKLDETLAYGNILNTRLYTGAELSYVTTGQNVPDDIEIIDPQKIVKSLLGGH
ncbi:MAG: flagellar biosynthesis protein FlhF [Lachnospiraceae bacterium]|nr:flagellar biosynthesis protein FlhF [Lachnospiraceae bacterium]